VAAGAVALIVHGAARLLGSALVLTIAVALSSCSTIQGPAHRGEGVATDGAAWTSGAVPHKVDGRVLSGFVAFGDFGGDKAQGVVAAAIQRWVAAGHRVDALVTTGDNVYNDGDPRQFGAQLDAPYRALRRTSPLWVTLGNHDVEGGHGPEQLGHLGLPALPYAKRLPRVELLFLDANRPDERQGAWLDQRLGAPGPAFRAVVFHQPAYSCGTEHGSTRAVIREWVPILERHRVALVLNGHEHDYQRFTSGASVTYVVTGGGGKSLYPILRSCSGVPARQAWAVRYHFVAVEVRRGSLELTAVDADSSVLDRAVLTR
jgi:calcineurin-like phosphoesterase family protein